MGIPIHDNVPLPALALVRVVEHRDAAGCLHDPDEGAAKSPKRQHGQGQPSEQTAFSQTSVLRTIMAIDPRRVVTGRAFCESRRGGRIVFTGATGPPLDFASLGRL